MIFHALADAQLTVSVTFVVCDIEPDVAVTVIWIIACWPALIDNGSGDKIRPVNCKGECGVHISPALARAGYSSND